MNAVLQVDGDPSPESRYPQARNDRNPFDSGESLKRAVRTLRAIRERYEMGRNVDSTYARAYSVQVALGHTDMLWITAAIEAMEKAIADSATVTRSRATATDFQHLRILQPVQCR
jgi:hypothetical protein